MLLALACFIIMISSLVQTAIGFGLALVAVPFLILIDPQMVPAPIVMIAFVQLLISAWLHKADIQWRLIAMATLARIPGTALAVWLMTMTGIEGIKIFVACSVFAAVAISLFNIQAQPNTKNHIIAGFFSGLGGTTTGIGGPPMALLYQHQQGDFVRANLSAFFVIGCLISLAGMAIGGFVTVQSWIYFLYFLPATLIGVWLGMKVKHRLKPAFMRPAILLLCSGSAAALLLQTLLS